MFAPFDNFFHELVPDVLCGGLFDAWSVHVFDCEPVFSSVSGTDFTVKKHSNQRGGLVDAVLRVRSASLVKMVNIGHRQERRRVRTNAIDS